jgi:putative spermidine/putrescine transport system permease protein
MAMGRPAGRRLAPLALAAPLAIFYLLFFCGPLLLLFGVSLFDDARFEQWGLKQYAAFFGDGYNLAVLGDTLRLGAMVTALAALLGYGVAYIYVELPRWWRAALLFLLITPLLTSTVVRTFAWVVILGREGLISKTLLALGLTATPLRLLNTEFGLVIALAQIEMPLMVLPLITAFSRVEPALLEASRSLGAGRGRTFFRVQLPLSLPGLLAGGMLVFVASMSAFVSQSLIGGGRLTYMPTHLYEQAVGLQNWPYAAAIAIVLLLAVLAVMSGFFWLGRRVLALGAA